MLASYLPYITLTLTLASLVLHFVAPKTDTKADDIAAEVVDVVKDALPKVDEPKQ